MYNESTKKATIKYMRDKRDKLTLDFPKGYKERYRQHAQSKGISLNRLIMDLLDEDIRASAAEQGIEIPSETDSDC